eukprot:CAMPEP_0113371510 /NCGR_PEP_ID=MMETSP0013_2-20120614/49_1 /TAXON_ID=2843 ORGANISM="Skeletonema costatum, Strain 1716" /NCGR_SAMPLE_ID=MMETSP0013_2 /ASSEMBLY_ACC=CAM_ASM_000158 /LENGTH=98 /DNA_ID=CAMNT_0000253359 /DNA_START=57 /DNA_END=349 /DNA_ORIENTATION=+ /assembly_acc=CAM_ASM_000158
MGGDNNNDDTPMDESSPRKDAAESLMDLVGAPAGDHAKMAVDINNNNDVEMNDNDDGEDSDPVAEVVIDDESTTPQKAAVATTTTPKLAGFADAKKTT